MKRPLRLCASLFAMGLASALGAETESVQLGDATIALPAPEGYFRFDGKSQKVDQFLQNIAPKTNRLLATFCSDTDLAQVLANSLPGFDRQFNSQSVIKLEAESVSPAQFENVKAGFRNRSSTAKVPGDVRAALESRGASALTELLGTRTDFKVGDVIQLGVFDETPDSISFSMLAKIQRTAADLGEPVERVVITAGSTIHVRDRVVFLNSSSGYREKGDIDWARSSLLKWRDAVVAANQSRTASGHLPLITGSGKPPAPPGFWDRVAENVHDSDADFWSGIARGAVIGALIALTTLMVRWFRAKRVLTPAGVAASGSAPHSVKSADKGYYLLQSGSQSGPFSLKQLREMTQRGEIATSATYRFETTDAWQPISRLAQLLKP